MCSPWECFIKGTFIQKILVQSAVDFFDGKSHICVSKYLSIAHLSD